MKKSLYFFLIVCFMFCLTPVLMAQPDQDSDTKLLQDTIEPELPSITMPSMGSLMGYFVLGKDGQLLHLEEIPLTADFDRILDSNGHLISHNAFIEQIVKDLETSVKQNSKPGEKLLKELNDGLIEPSREHLLVDVIAKGLIRQDRNNQLVYDDKPLGIFFDDGILPPKATTHITFVANLNPAEASISLAFDSTNSSTYSFVFQSMVVDSLGMTHPLSLYFVKIAANSAWQVHVQLGDNDSVELTTIQMLDGRMPNDLSKTLLPVKLTPVTADGQSVAKQLDIMLDISKLTQYSFGSEKQNFKLISSKQDGYPSAQFHSWSVDNQVVWLRYNNGERREFTKLPDWVVKDIKKYLK